MRKLSLVFLLLLLLTLSACAAPGDEPAEAAGDRSARIKSQM